MDSYLRKAIRIGVILGIIVVYLLLIGFPIILSTIIGDMLNAETSAAVGNSTGYLTLMVLIGLITGAAASGNDESISWNQVALSGILAGAITGIFGSIFMLITGQLSVNGIDFRTYLAQLSPEVISLYLYGRQPVEATIFNLGLFTLSGLIGALFTSLWVRSNAGSRLSAWRLRSSQAVSNSSLATWYNTTPLARYLFYGLLLLIAFLTPLLFDQYWNFILGTVGIYVLMGLGLNIVVGMAGLLDLGYVAFFAVGAYTIGLLTSPKPLGVEWGFWIVLPMAVLIAAMSGILLGIPVLRLRGDYLAIVTLGFGEIIRVLVKSDALAPFLGGPQGIRDIAGPTLFGRPFDNERAFLYIIILGIILIIFITLRLESSRVGRSWIAMREDETIAQAMGISTYRSKLLAFAIGAAFAGLGGVLFASRNQYTGPEDHNLLVSINVLSIVIVGGMGSIPGIILGAFALKGLPEILRQIEDYRILAFGGLLVVMMIWRPEGLWPAKRRSLEIHAESQLETAPPAEETPTMVETPATSTGTGET
jgi:ABC-type branched-subunit amino acid transport system permease subunit